MTRKLNKCRAFTLVETLAGVIIGSWVLIGCYVVLAGTIENTQSVYADNNPEVKSIEAIINQMERDITQGTGIYTANGMMLINGHSFNETQWHMSSGDVLAYDMSQIFRSLSLGYSKSGKSLTLKQVPSVYTLLVMGNQGRVIAYYEIMNNSNTLEKSVEIKRHVGPSMTNHIFTNQISELKLEIDTQSKFLILTKKLGTGSVRKHKFLLPFAPV